MLFKYFHWTSNVIQTFGTFVPIAIILGHDHYHNIPFVRAPYSDLSDAPDENLIKLTEDELFLISSKEATPIDRTEFSLMVIDDIESNTVGFFQYRYGNLFQFSVRLALNDVDTIRKEYPNFFKLFKENGLGKLHMDTTKLTNSDLQNVLLSNNAKKFAIAREIHYANSIKAMIPAFISLLLFLISLGFCYFARKKIRDLPSLIISLFGGIALHFPVLKHYYANEVLSLDDKAVKIDNNHKIGCIEYLRSSIELGKLLHSLTEGKLDYFDEEGNCKQHVVDYTTRLSRILELEVKNAHK